MGLVLLIIGCVLMLAGGLWFLVKAFQESILWGVGCLLCGLVQLVFLVMHFGKTWRPLAVQMAGLLFIFGGSALSGVNAVQVAMSDGQWQDSSQQWPQEFDSTLTSLGSFTQPTPEDAPVEAPAVTEDDNAVRNALLKSTPKSAEEMLQGLGVSVQKIGSGRDAILGVDLTQQNMIQGERINFEVVMYLKKLKHVFLSVAGTSFTDKGLAELEAMQKLEGMNLSKTQVTDEGMKYLKQYPDLRLLILDDTAVGDLGLDSIINLTNLRMLSLSGTQVSDLGIEQLQNLEELRVLVLTGTAVTPEGARKLAKSLPNCNIRQ